ncbi:MULTISPECIES: 2-polyprenylphenol 6-hydroxylase [unclassified Thermoanaerobacterium]|uniref:2-polyprenylphenol 6-hydroxylase n=1 Tax=unclassified Thermoanaerobacterium TaxID=2622527 RepID=UPI000A1640EE|nr:MULTISPECIES: 2-polyprenylphenol 6-hydroxylase [unclassified Thermoanaerobacterium]MDE4541928.1 2-polyprenylphenol 6-hydroxylase [Thermoanaerobacterium sp. R66]ORX23907.1 2-polyprenylphenol 6-hydroxylase [Thermoanaerobacterium sp. PSU-2]HHV73530.1 2-polyprenylphenol 6-hydroxylase [Thermoanaerobacterium sp.]
MNLFSIFSTRKYIKRYREILKILTKNGFGFISEVLSKKKSIPFVYIRKNDLPIALSERIRITLEELGPTFVKMGQLLSTRPDLLPHDVINELSKLQDDVPPVEFDTMRQIVEDELGDKISNLFLTFDKEPIASASIGQVYKAVTREGNDVVVKVQRPGVYEKITADIIILKTIAKILNERLTDSPVDFLDVVNELSESLLNELDYTLEGNNADKFRENFINESYVYIPKIYWEYTTKKVLTMEYIDGISVKNKEKLRDSGFDLKKIAYNGAMSIFMQIFVYGFFHGDPHPGNILIRRDGKLSYIDFGIVGYIDRSNREMIVELFKAFVDNDTDEVVSILTDMDAIRDGVNIRHLKYDLSGIISYFYNTPLKNININDSAKKITSIIYKYKLIMPAEFTLLLKSLATIEGVGKELDPDFSISDIAKDFVKKIYINNFNFAKTLSENAKDLHKIYVHLKKFPSKLQGIISKILKDNVRVKLDIEETEKMKYDLNSMINKMIISIIAASLIIGSSLIMSLNGGYKVYGYNAVGLVGYLISFILCMAIVYYILFIEKKRK